MFHIETAGQLLTPCCFRSISYFRISGTFLDRHIHRNIDPRILFLFKTAQKFSKHDLILDTQLCVHFIQALLSLTDEGRFFLGTVFDHCKNFAVGAVMELQIIFLAGEHTNLLRK